MSKMGMRTLPFFKNKKGWHVAGSNYGDEGGTPYELPPATASTLGGVKVGNGLNVTNDGVVSTDVSALANKTDLSAIIATGTTNATGSQINTGTYFYLNGVYCVAKTDIPTDAAFAENTNYETVSVGAVLASNITYTVTVPSEGSLNVTLDPHHAYLVFTDSYTVPLLSMVVSGGDGYTGTFDILKDDGQVWSFSLSDNVLTISFSGIIDRPVYIKKIA